MSGKGKGKKMNKNPENDSNNDESFTSDNSKINDSLEATNSEDCSDFAKQLAAALKTQLVRNSFSELLQPHIQAEVNKLVPVLVKSELNKSVKPMVDVTSDKILSVEADLSDKIHDLEEKLQSSELEQEQLKNNNIGT
jgi:hypothetical protein